MIEKNLKEINDTAERMTKEHLILVCQEVSKTYTNVHDIVNTISNIAVKLSASLVNLAVEIGNSRGNDLCPAHIFDMIMKEATVYLHPCKSEKHRIGKH